MKALHFFEHGSLDKLQYGEIDRPKPNAGEVLLRVKACALNHLDLWVLSGWPGLHLQLPHVGGADIAGEIVELGPEVSSWKIGDRVVVNPGYLDGEDEWTKRGEDSVSPHYHIYGEARRGGFAEFVTVSARNLATFPKDFTYAAACAALLTGLTAWRMLQERAQLKRGETVLVVGAGGGVNSFTIQLAKYLGGTVIALTSTQQKMDKATALGAAHVIDYKKYPDWSRVVKSLTKNRGVDIVIDNVGARTFEQSIRAVARGGRIVTVGNTSGPAITFDNRLVFTKQISIIGSTMGSEKSFHHVLECLWSGAVKPVIDRELPLSEGPTAYRLLQSGEQFGKIVLLP